MVSVNRSSAPAAFREPLPLKQLQSSYGRPFRSNMFIAHSGYRTRYPLVAAATRGRLG